MSDSEEESAFQSADEGDNTELPPTDKKGDLGKKHAKGGKPGNVKKDKEAAPKAAAKGGGSQDREQGKGRNKKKRGKGGQQVSKGDKELSAKQAEPQKKNSGPTEESTEVKSPPDTMKQTLDEVNKEDPAPVKSDEKEAEVKEESTELKEESTELKEESTELKNKDKAEVEEESAEPKNRDKDVSTVSDTPSSKSNNDSDIPKAGAVAAEAAGAAADVAKPNPEPTGDADGAPSSEENDSHTAASLLDRLAEERAVEQSTGWGWGGWGSSLMNTVQTSVDTFTTSVGEGLHTVMETAETALGAPTAEELAEQKKIAKEVKGDALETPVEEKEEPFTASPPKQEMIRESAGEAEPGSPEAAETKETSELSDGGGGGGGGWLGGWGAKATSWGSGLTQKLQTTSKTLVTGTLDVLETVGKKTYETIAEGDHGIKQALHNKENKANLSQVLRDAKEQAEREAKLEEEFVESRKAHFGAMFDEYQGLVHLEALEMLSNQCEAKVHSIVSTISGDQLQPIKTDLISIKDAFVIEDLEDAEDTEDQDFAALVTDADAKLDVGASSTKLIQVQERCHSWVEECIKEQGEGKGKEAKEIHQASIQSMADLTARAVEHFHKAGELILTKKGTMTINNTRAQSLASLTRALCTEVGIMSTKFTQCLTTAADNSEDSDAVNPLITNVYLEAGNSSTYIQDAFQLLLPVLQQATLEGWS